MGLSLRDQLLQAGLINEKQAKQAARQHGQQRREQERSPAAAAAAEKQRLEAEKAAAAKAARDAELNRVQQEKLAQKERRAQIKQLIEQHRVAIPDGEDYYNFIDGKRIRRLPVTPALRAQLGSGVLQIVRSDGRYHFVPAAIAERIGERDPYAVVKAAVQPAASTPGEDDPYKDFVVPDDLMW